MRERERKRVRVNDFDGVYKYIRTKLPYRVNSTFRLKKRRIISYD